jgi:hypothetical protein
MRLAGWMVAVMMMALVAAVAARAESPDPSQIYIEKINHNGNGCRPGSVASLVAPGAEAFTLLFDDYIVDTSNRGHRDRDEDREPGGNAAQKHCNISLDMHVPDGWAFTLHTLDVRGFANLPAKATGFQRTTYFFKGSEREVGKLELKGPKSEDYFHRTSTPLSQAEWSPCKGRARNLQIRTSIRVQGKGLLTVDSTDGEFKQRYGIAWKKCR